MLHLLENIRQKPKMERQAIAFSLSLGITGVIFVIWAVSFFGSIESGQGRVESGVDTSGLTTFIDSFKEVRGTVQEEVGSIQGQLEQVASGLDEYENEEAVKEPIESDSSTLTAEQELVPDETSQSESKGVGEVESQEATPRIEVTPSGVEIIEL